MGGKRHRTRGSLNLAGGAVMHTFQTAMNNYYRKVTSDTNALEDDGGRLRGRAFGALYLRC